MLVPDNCLFCRNKIIIAQSIEDVQKKRGKPKEKEGFSTKIYSYVEAGSPCMSFNVSSSTVSGSSAEGIFTLI